MLDRSLIWQVPLAGALLGAVLAGVGAPERAFSLCGAVALAATAGELTRRDARERRLPNRMTLPAAMAGLLGAVLAGVLGAPGWWVPVVAGVAFGGLMLLLALLGGLGMGDVKLALAIGLASPTPEIAVAAPVLGMLAGGVAGAVGLVRSGPRHRMPYGPFLVAGWVVATVAAAVLHSTGR